MKMHILWGLSLASGISLQLGGNEDGAATGKIGYISNGMPMIT
jgi:hypothetical protein